jgi:hypothetical protein
VDVPRVSVLIRSVIRCSVRPSTALVGDGLNLSIATPPSLRFLAVVISRGVSGSVITTGPNRTRLEIGAPYLGGRRGSTTRP